MSWKSIASVVALWTALLSGAEALSLVAWTDADRIERADRIVIGTVAQDGEMSVVTVEKVLKGDTEPKVIRTKFQPRHDDWESDSGESDKVVWVERDGDRGMNPLSGLFHIAEGSPRWRLYHALLDPEPLVKDPDLSWNFQTAQVLGYLFDPVKISSREAPKVADHLLEYSALRGNIPWGFEGLIELKCRKKKGARMRISVDSISDESVDGRIIGKAVDGHYLDEEAIEPVPSGFTLRIDTRRTESVGSLSHEAAAAFLRGRLNMLPDEAGKNRRDNGNARDQSERMTVAAIKALERMRDAEAVPQVIEIAEHVDDNYYLAPFQFLEAAKDPRSLEPMCKLLEKHAHEFPENHWYSYQAARVLGELGDPAALPYLEDAVQYGVESAFHPLARFGRVESLGIIVESAPVEGFEANTANPLYFLVLRSNREPEPWMEPKRIVSGEAHPKLKAKWQDWWQANKNGVNLVRSFDEMMTAEQPAMDERNEKFWIQHKRKRHFQDFLWAYVSGFLVVAGVLIWRLCRKRPLAE